METGKSFKVREKIQTGISRAVFMTLFALAPVGGLEAQPIFVKFTSPMKFLANSADPLIGVTWIQTGFNDATWTSGTYGVGYDTDPGPPAVNLLQTTVTSGKNSIYTRSTFNVGDKNAVDKLILGCDYDDGYIAWINGTEVFRSAQMPAGNPAWNTAAASHESSNGRVPNYGTLQDITLLGKPALVNGNNVLAIGVWNTGATSTDLVLVPKLLMNVTRGPYLQRQSASQIVVRWRTLQATNSRVRFGLAPGALTSTVQDLTSTTEHAITLTGLTPDTTFFYDVGTTTTVLAGGDANHFFVMPPAAGSFKATRVWVVGDSGTANKNAVAVKNAFTTFTGAVHPDLWLMLGDNAYQNGTDGEFQVAVFDTYPEILRKTALWPTLGNHEFYNGATSSITQTGPYFSSFTLPTAAEAGGVASATEAYYSFDYGNIHFVCLDSHHLAGQPAVAGANNDRADMTAWLTADLSATTHDWIVVFFHHPPYTKGSHNSDDANDSKTDQPAVTGDAGRMTIMREAILPILEAFGVDLVLTGHSHSYERSLLLRGHSATAGEFRADPDRFIKDQSDGREEGAGGRAYLRPSLGLGPNEGVINVVAGSSGEASGGFLNHPVMVSSLNQLGSLVLDVNADADGFRLEATFVSTTAGVPTVTDHFTIVKGKAILESCPAAIQLTAGSSFAKTGPDLIAAADILDGDGDLDLIVSKGNDYSIDIFRNNGAGSFTLGTSLLGYQLEAKGFATGDFDGNGFVDLAVASSWTPGVRVFSNLNGQGSFSQASHWNGSYGPRIVTADLDGDSDLDLAVPRYYSDDVVILWNNGTGFTEGGAYSTGTSGYPAGISSGDFDLDGDIDLVVGYEDSYGYHFTPMMNGGGIFSSAGDIPFWTGYGSLRSIVAAKLDGDALPDVALTTTGPYLLIFQNLGGGSFSTNPIVISTGELGTNASVEGLRASDLDGDGDVDLAGFVRTSNLAATIENLGGFSFTFASNPTDSGPASVAVADLDQDGMPDLAVANQTANTVRTFINQASANPRDCNGNGALDACDIARATSPDCNDNGIPDECDVSVFGGFAPKVSFPVQTTPRGAATADVDGDGDRDLIVVNSASNSVSILKNNGDGTFALPVSVAVGATPFAVAAVHLDNDAAVADPDNPGQTKSADDVDLVVVNSAGNSMTVLKNNGTGVFTVFQTVASLGTGPQSLVALDVNPKTDSIEASDKLSDVDVVVASFTSNQIRLLKAVDSGTFSVVQTIAVAGPVGLAAGDIDSDRDYDVAVARTGGITIHKSTSTSTVDGILDTSAPTNIVLANPSAITAEDLDGDGDLDFAVAQELNDTITVLLNGGGANPVFTVQPAVAVGDGPVSIAAYDVDEDTDVDLVTANVNANTVSILLNNGPATFAPAISLSAGASPRAVRVGDINGDGVADVITSNSGSNNVSVIESRTTIPGSFDANSNNIPDECPGG